MEKVLIGQATDEQIAKWKEQHGDVVHEYAIEDRVCYLREVDRETYSLAASKISVSPAKFTEEILKQIWLGGDDTIRKTNGYFFGLADFVEELMAKKKGSLRKL